MGLHGEVHPRQVVLQPHLGPLSHRKKALASGSWALVPRDGNGVSGSDTPLTPEHALRSHTFSPQDWIDLVIAVCPPKEYDDEL